MNIRKRSCYGNLLDPSLRWDDDREHGTVITLLYDKRKGSEIA